MAALETIKYSPDPADPIPNMYQKINEAIEAINRITADNKLQTIVANIGDWNMDTDTFIQVSFATLGISDPTKIRGIDILIRGDVGSGNESLVPLNCAHINSGGDCFTEATDTEPQGGIDFATSCDNIDGIVLYRKPSGLFDSAEFDSTSYNRGFIKITLEI